jgi:uncharacterized protein
MPLLTVAAVGALAGAVLAAYAFLIEPRWLDVRRIEIAPARWPRHLDGLTVAHLSDLHLGAPGSGALVRRALAVVDAARPDLVVLTGDYTVRGKDPTGVRVALADLHTRPAFAVLGNHDYKAGPAAADEIAAEIAGLGITVLRNAAVECPTRRGMIWIAGLDEHRYGHADVRRTLGQIPADAWPRVLLAHTPAALHRLPDDAVDLALAGHTHGGQVRLPPLTTWYVRLVYSRFVAGAYPHRGAVLYVSRGLASVGIPARFLCRPEVTLVTLRHRR